MIPASPRTIPTMEQKISPLTHDCQSGFESLIETLKSSEDKRFGDEASNVGDELARFRLWANNIGAANRGIASLDYRLRNAEYLSRTFENLLSSLSETLVLGFTLSDLSFADLGSDHSCKRRGRYYTQRRFSE